MSWCAGWPRHRGGTVMIDTPKKTRTRDQNMAFVHITVAKDKIREVMGPGLKEVSAALEAQRIKPTGPWFTHHLRMDPKVWDFHICLPLEGAAKVKPTGRVAQGLLASANVVRTIYRGGYEGLGEGWGAFDTWIREQGLEIK